MKSDMMVSLIVYGPTIVLVLACVGIVWSVKKNKKYLSGFIFLFLGAGIHYLGLFVGAWEGMGISLFLGGGFVLLGLITLLITFLYSELRVAKKQTGA